VNRIQGPINPVTPEDYLEGCIRLAEIGFSRWDELEDGDGETPAPDDIITRTDVLLCIRGAADYGLDALKSRHGLRNMINKLNTRGDDHGD